MNCCNTSCSDDSAFLADVINAPLNRRIFAWMMTVLLPGVGIATNAVVVFIGVHVRLQKTGDFKYFLTTMAIMDILWCITVLLYQPYFTPGGNVNEYNVYALAPLPSDLRVPVRYVWMATQMAMGFPLVLLSMNRYLLVCRSQQMYGTVFGGWRTPMLCAATLPLGAAINAPYLFDATRHVKKCLAAEFEQYVESYATDSWTNEMRLGLIMATLLCCYVICLSCALAIFHKLSTHSRASLSQADARRLRENRAVLRAICVQTALPLIISLPTIFDLLALKSLQHNWWLQVCAAWTLHLNPLCDAVATLYIIRPYRRIVRRWCDKLVERSHRIFSLSRDKVEKAPCRTELQEMLQKLSVMTMLEERRDDESG
uniref:G-protein coupled receptors family 1 profile domain-containing protein n=1 Tax=Plectus sambesii TaxID=2011161 RepID=A0A914WUC5_9BILA